MKRILKDWNEGEITGIGFDISKDAIGMTVKFVTRDSAEITIDLDILVGKA